MRLPTDVGARRMYEHVRISVRDGGWHRYTGYIMHRGFYPRIMHLLPMHITVVAG